MNQYLNMHSNITGFTNIQITNLPSTTSNKFSLLPVSIRIAAQTIGLDLVAVKPLSAPSGLLSGIDFKYNPTLLEIRRKKINRLMRIMKVKQILETIKNY